jgi:hypothetical protein
MFISVVYLIISEICIFNVHVCWLFVVHGTLFTALCCSRDLDLCMWFHAYVINDKSFDFKISSEN